MTQDEFMSVAINPFKIDDTYIDEVHDIYFLYREKMLNANNFAEFYLIAKQFKFMALGVKSDLDKIVNPNMAFPRIKKLFSDKVSALQLANLVLPKPMLFGHIISQKYQVPEYWAAVQWFSSQLQESGNTA